VSCHVRITALLCTLCAALSLCRAQNLSPRAYVIVPLHSNAVTFTYSLKDGDVVFSPSLPVQNAHGRIGNELLTYFHTLDFFGRSSNINVTLPYAVGHLTGEVAGVDEKLYRSGLAGLVGRFSVNLVGGPSMEPREYAKWKEKTIVGVSLLVQAPTGQYDPALLINVGDNRWAFKPEVGFSRRWGNWVLDAYGAVWFFTANDNFWRNAPGTHPPNRQTQAPMGATELHLSYNFKPRLWASIDGNYWHGGATSVNGIETPTTLQANSRIGATVAIPITKHQSLKASYSAGDYTTFGGNFQDVSIAWQYSWLGRPK
jgi:Putative MetA-pathway of phenol degradation